jgi:tetratricopeptide (TPR) repeat protein
MNRQFCWKCGARLLVTASHTHSESMTPMDRMDEMDEHVLERVSALEYAVSGLTRRVEALAESVERVAANNFIDHTMIETLTDSLEAAGIDLASLEAEWRRRLDMRMAENEEIDRLGERMEQIIASYRGPHRKSFTMWMERAYEQIASERHAESLVSLESAMAEDPTNDGLAMLLAEVFFESREFAAAGRCLGQVLERQPDHFEATLLLGLLEKGHGNIRQAQRLLERAVALRDDSHSAHASLGSLLIDRGKGREAQTHLKRALELKPTATAHYMLGSIYREDGNRKRALDQFERATELDPQFGEAFYQMGLVCQAMNWSRKAQECFRRAKRLGSTRPTDTGGLARGSRTRPTGGRKTGRRKSKKTENRIDPDYLNGLVRDELHLTTCWNGKRAK